MVADLMLTLGRMAVVGLIAIGISGAIAGGMGAAFGTSFVSGDSKHISYTQARCADFFEYEPQAHSCEEAATLHHYGEVVDYRLAAGVLGLFALVAYVWLRRRVRGSRTLPPEFEPTVGATLYGAATLVLLASSLTGLVIGETQGAGQSLSGAIVALALAGYYGYSVYRALLDRSST
jgi:hypothetical protein